MKKDGIEVIYATREEADAEASRLSDDATPNLRYWVESAYEPEDDEDEYVGADADIDDDDDEEDWHDDEELEDLESEQIRSALISYDGY